MAGVAMLGSKACQQYKVKMVKNGRGGAMCEIYTSVVK